MNFAYLLKYSFFASKKQHEGLCYRIYFKAEKNFLFCMRKMSREFPDVKNSYRM